MSAHVFTYGSLMYPAVFNHVVQQVYQGYPYRLYGYRRWAVLDEHYPAIFMANVDDFVDGILYLDVTATDLQRLDRFEGDYYQRQTVTVLRLSDNEEMIAEAYIFKSYYSYLLAQHDWDAEHFKRVGINEFMQRYQGFLTVVQS